MPPMPPGRSRAFDGGRGPPSPPVLRGYAFISEIHCDGNVGIRTDFRWKQPLSNSNATPMPEKYVKEYRIFSSKPPKRTFQRRHPTGTW